MHPVFTAVSFPVITECFFCLRQFLSEFFRLRKPYSCLALDTFRLLL